MCHPYRYRTLHLYIQRWRPGLATHFRAGQEWHPQALVVGLPRHADGSDSDMTRGARKFAQLLGARYGLPVHTMDERLSSHTAGELLQRNAHKAAAGIDAIAAMIILQDWLDTEQP